MTNIIENNEVKYLSVESIFDNNGDCILDRKSDHQEITFVVNYGTGASKCYLIQDMKEDKFWILSTGACIKSHYSDADRSEAKRLSTEKPLQHNDVVRIRGKFGKQYRVHVNGNYSDLGYLIPIN